MRMTQTEILTFAIRWLDTQIESWRLRCADLPAESSQMMFEQAAGELVEKRKVLTHLYEIETGEPYEV